MILMTMLEIIGLTYKVGRHKVHAVYQSSGRPHRCVCVCARARMPGKGDAGQYQR